MVSIFVNPTQFGPNEDYAEYPRPLTEDADRCVGEGVDYLFTPEAREIAEHARKVGLADMPQLGVAREQHHPFKLNDLLETMRNTSFKEALTRYDVF